MENLVNRVGKIAWILPLLLLYAMVVSPDALAHNVSEDDKSYIESISGVNIIPFMYLGAKHMFTGYDHIMFLFGVIFFLYRLKDVGIYVTLFAVGHSMTLMIGVLAGIQANAYIVDMIIGLSVVYKAFDNLGGFKTVIGFTPNQKAAVLIFGWFHGFGLATKLQEMSISEEGLFANLVSFNVGVEIGQMMALCLILITMNYWRKSKSFLKHAVWANVILMAGGFVLTGYQFAGYLLEV